MASVFETLEARMQEVTSRRAFLAGGVGLGAALAGYAVSGGRHQLEVIENTVKLPALGARFHGFRVAQLSDIHLVEFTEEWFLRHAVDRINALQPDMVLLTGDFISRGPFGKALGRHSMPRCAEALAELRCPLKFAVLGNHDVSVSPGIVERELRRVGIPVLVNRAEAVDLGGDRLWIAGVDDPGVSTPDLYKAVPPGVHGHPLILMAHEPDFFDFVRGHPRGADVDLVLSGHTHGGQVRLPLLGPLVLPPLGVRYVHGAFQRGPLQLYVNRGLGTVGVPFRFVCPAEITVHTLVAV